MPTKTGAQIINFRPGEGKSAPAALMKEVKSTCCYCGVGCGIVVHKEKNGSLRVEGDKDHPVNKGMLCSKGMNLTIP